MISRKLVIEKNSLIDFASNDYLGLSKSAIFKSLLLKDLEKLSYLGATGSRLVSGNHIKTYELEQKIALYHKSESALIYGSGFLANIGILPALTSNKDIILYASNVHASLHQGIALSAAKSYPFREKSLEQLESCLKKHPKGAYLVIQSINSVDGSLYPLKELEALIDKYEPKVILDEAHAVGIYGPNGEGLSVANDLHHKIYARVITFGKALGSYGAAVLGKASLIDKLINHSKSFIYSTALPSYVITAIENAYKCLPLMQQERQHLLHLAKASSLSKHLSPIQSVHVGCAKCAKELEYFIKEKGYHVKAFLFPSSRRRKEVIRICLHAYNSLSSLKHLESLIPKGTLCQCPS